MIAYNKKLHYCSFRQAQRTNINYIHGRAFHSNTLYNNTEVVDTKELLYTAASIL